MASADDKAASNGSFGFGVGVDAGVRVAADDAEGCAVEGCVVGIAVGRTRVGVDVGELQAPNASANAMATKPTTCLKSIQSSFRISGHILAQGYRNAKFLA